MTEDTGSLSIEDQLVMRKLFLRSAEEMSEYLLTKEEVDKQAVGNIERLIEDQQDEIAKLKMASLKTPLASK